MKKVSEHCTKGKLRQVIFLYCSQPVCDIVEFILCSIAPALLRQASYGTLKMGLYQRFKRLFSPHHNKGLLTTGILTCVCINVMVVSIEGSLPTNVLAGMLAGVLSSSVANPTDVLKVT